MPAHRRTLSPFGPPTRLASLAILASTAAVLVAPGPAAAQTTLFADGFEVGTAGRWSVVEPPIIMVCDCYFSGDCNGQFCDWGILTQEDNCTFSVPKPQGVFGAGCDVDQPGPWIGGICDGRCVPFSAGSTLGGFDPAILAEGVELWSEAMLVPAANGGGPVDPVFSAAAMALPIGEEQCLVLGRQVASLISETAGIGFYDYFCHFEAGDPSTRFHVDLSVDKCRLMAGRLAAEALAAELLEPGSCDAVLAEIPLHCGGAVPAFGGNCPVAGPEALTCLGGRIQDLAVFLTTPRMDVLFGPAPGF